MGVGHKKVLYPFVVFLTGYISFIVTHKIDTKSSLLV